MVGFEGGAEPLEGSGGIELVDFPFHLLRDEFSLEVCFRIA